MLKNALLAGALSSLAVVALAHNGATGVVMERMMGMSAMRGAMAAIAPMMQGTAPYDVRVVQENASQIAGHAGLNMTSLFPKSDANVASYVKPEIWEQWEDFERMAGELRQYAEGLVVAAPNGLEAPAPTTGPTPDRVVALSSGSEPLRLTVAQLMGVMPKPDVRPAVASASSDGTINWAALAADDVFEMIGQVCSSCHAQFRSGN